MFGDHFIWNYMITRLSLSALGLLRYAKGLLLMFAWCTSPWVMKIRPGTTELWARSILWKNNHPDLFFIEGVNDELPLLFLLLKH